MKNIMERYLRPTARNSYFTGKLLLAMPFLEDIQFSQSVIYVCGHDSQGAIGLIVNKKIPNLTFKDLVVQLHLKNDYAENFKNFEVHYGGPIEITRGFVLHSNDYFISSTVAVDQNFSVTSTLEILRALSQNRGPQNFLVCLGYTGWSPGQLESEVQDNHWMVVEANDNLLFETSLSEKWRNSMATIGVDPMVLSIDSGHA